MAHDVILKVRRLEQFSFEEVVSDQSIHLIDEVSDLSRDNNIRTTRADWRSSTPHGKHSVPHLVLETIDLLHGPSEV